MCFVDFTYNRENDNNYRNNMVTALEVFDALQDNIKKIKEGQFDKNNLNNNSVNNGSNISGNKNSFIINENMNSNGSNINNNIKINININNNNIYNYESNNTNSKNKKKLLDNPNKEGKQLIKINNVGVHNTKTKPINIFSNKSHYIPVSNNKSSLKANSKGKNTKKSNEINIGKKISHPTSATGTRQISNNQYVRKNVKMGSSLGNANKSGNISNSNVNNVPIGKYQTNKNSKIATTSILNNKRISTKIKK